MPESELRVRDETLPTSPAALRERWRELGLHEHPDGPRDRTEQLLDYVLGLLRVSIHDDRLRQLPPLFFWNDDATDRELAESLGRVAEVLRGMGFGVYFRPPWFIVNPLGEKTPIVPREMPSKWAENLRHYPNPAYLDEIPGISPAR